MELERKGKYSFDHRQMSIPGHAIVAYRGKQFMTCTRVMIHDSGEVSKSKSLRDVGEGNKI